MGDYVLLCVVTFSLENMNSEEHKNKLKTLCCICCGKIQKNCNKNNFATEISDIYKVDVQNENEHIYPHNICSACRLKLTRYRQNKGSVQFCEIFSFELHNDNCKVCISKGRPKKLVKENFQ